MPELTETSVMGVKSALAVWRTITDAAYTMVVHGRCQMYLNPLMCSVGAGVRFGDCGADPRLMETRIILKRMTLEGRTVSKMAVLLESPRRLFANIFRGERR